MSADPNPIVTSIEGLDRTDPHPAEEGDPYHNRRTTFTAQEIEEIKRLLQEAADEPPDTFSTNAVVGTLRQAIETLRINGMADDNIAAALTQGVGATITAEQVAKVFGKVQL